MPIISGVKCLVGRSNMTCRRECLALPHIRGLCTELFAKLFVAGLSGNTNEQVLKDTFSRYGEVLDARVMINSQSGWSKGYGFVQFASETEADYAITQMDGQKLNGKKIVVNYARPTFKDTIVDPPRALGPPQILEGNEEKEKVERKSVQKATSPKSQASKTNEQKKMSKVKENNEKGGKKEKGLSSLKRQTFIEDLDEDLNEY